MRCRMIVREPSGEHVSSFFFTASTFHEAWLIQTDDWNDKYGHTDRYRSSMYELYGDPHRWHLRSVINW